MKKLNSCLLSAVMVASSLGVVQAGTIDKIVGKDRFDTAAKIADRLGKYNTVVLVNGYSTADGLSASSLAEYKRAPILLTKENSIPDATAQRLRNVSKVYIIGGPKAISTGVESQLRKQGKTVIRLSGHDRVDTSIEVAKALGGYNKAFIVNGFKGEADAMSVSAVAARNKAPIIITNGETAPTFRDSKVSYYAIGGTQVVSDSLADYYRATRIAGSNRYETNKKVLERFYSGSEKYYYVNGATLVDALTASTIAESNGIALVSKNSNKSYLEGKDLVQVGGMDFTVNLNPGGDTENPGGEDIENPGGGTENPGESGTENPGGEDSEVVMTPKVVSYTNPVTVNKGDSFSVGQFNIVAYDHKGNRIPVSNMELLTDVNTDSADKWAVRVRVHNGSYYTDLELTLIVKETDKIYEINSPEFQGIARAEFYRLLDDFRAKNGVGKTVHHKCSEESSLMKSKYMAENDYFGHEDNLIYTHGRGAECIASFGSFAEPFTAEKAKNLGEAAFNAWSTSTKGHREILLLTENTGDYSTTIDGFSFYGKRKSNGGYTIYCTYHQKNHANNLM